MKSIKLLMAMYFKFAKGGAGLNFTDTLPYIIKFVPVK